MNLADAYAAAVADTPQMPTPLERKLAVVKIEAARAALESALEQQPVQKPVACRFCHSEKGCWTWQCYHCGEIDDVQKPAPPQQQAEPPEWLLIKNILDEYGLQAIDFVAEFKAAQQVVTIWKQPKQQAPFSPEVINTTQTAWKMGYEAAKAEQQQAESVSMRMPKVGDKVICLEDESLGKVVSLTAGGSPDIKFDDGSHGTYLLREFAELFGYVASPLPVQPEPVRWDKPSASFDEWWDGDRRRDNANPFTTDSFAYWAWEGWQAALAQRPWQGLTAEDLAQIESDEFWQVGNHMAIAMAVEAKLKERNHG